MDSDSNLLARYANWFNIGHNSFEFIVDFGQHHAGQGEPLVHTRIVVGPAYAKVLCNLLNDSIRQYERDLGEIPNAE